jgi:hypothetical protein
MAATAATGGEVKKVKASLVTGGLAAGAATAF